MLYSVSVGSVSIDYLWTKRGMGLGKVLFAFTRYLPFVSIPLVIQVGSLLFPGLDDAKCLFFLRTYVMWDCRRSILYIVWALFTMGVVPVAVLIALTLSTAETTTSPIPNLPGCLVVNVSSNILTTSFAVLIVVELAISTLIVVIRVARERPRFGLLKTIVRDGAIYCFCVTLFSIVNMVMSLVHGPATNIFDSYQATFHGILASRLQLYLASMHDSTLQYTNTGFSSVQFEERIVNRPESHIDELECRRRERCSAS
ncbi:hypothetical protein CONPUDRAFT_88134 [Coniophora puteana RWD-64-598 SS2]|uniref:Uncharacterized protein n=1 Tax=Coniophora puteana (strain RWD-64-598) TaxID=741705 RepID=A0A5M3MWR9_CONPW|nr:uncharacterized protein CONPUDRAFT_88134 [Coniophora puteana RWD-64-598 SS2]EIW83588.1 hypothetical protein CONPUDRAFT_88134 [Coniophora puteana RWD-64-598 SS2]